MRSPAAVHVGGRAEQASSLQLASCYSNAHSIPFPTPQICSMCPVYLILLAGGCCCSAVLRPAPPPDKVGCSVRGPATWPVILQVPASQAALSLQLSNGSQASQAGDQAWHMQAMSGVCSSAECMRCKSPPWHRALLQEWLQLLLCLTTTESNPPSASA